MHGRLKPLAWLAVAALLLHVAALGGLQWTWPQRVMPPLPTDAMRVRVVEPDPVRDADAASDQASAHAAAVSLMAAPLKVTPPPGARPALRRPEVPLVRAVAAPVTASASPRPAAPLLALADPPTEVAPPPRPASMAEAPAGPSALDATSPAPASFADETIPLYRTRMPPAVLLRYELQRGGLRGSGELLWRPQGDRYTLQLDGRVGPLAVLTQVSTGGFDAAGLAPLRFTDRRLRRPTSAANFQREAGKITFSGPATEFALRPGLQDRLSWMIQLAAIVAAEPALRAAGATVVIGAVGAHADAAVWALRCVGAEPTDANADAIEAIKYVREPRDPYDTTVQVWLDPSHHYLPAQAMQKSGPKDEGYVLRLREIAAAP